MTLKILHTSDWHLGKRLHEHDLKEDQRHFIDQFLDRVKHNDYNAVIIAGDVFDRSIPSKEAIALFDEFLYRFCELNVVGIIIPGNHDSAVRLSYLSGLVKRFNIHLKCSPAEILTPITLTESGETVCIWCVPFLSSHDLDNVEGFNPPDGETDVLRIAANGIEQKIKEMKTEVTYAHAAHVFTGHLFASGAEKSDSERDLVGGSSNVSCDIFSAFDYTALGHLHGKQEPAPGVFYSGSPVSYSFSEAAQKKVMLDVSFYFTEKAHHPQVTINEIPLKPLRSMKRLSGTWNDVISADTGVYADSYLEITFSGQPDIADPYKFLKERFPYLLSLRREADTKDGKSNRSRRKISGKDFFADFKEFQKFIHNTLPDDYLEKEKILTQMMETKQKEESA